MNTYADDIHKHLRCKERKRFKFRGQSAQLQLRPKMIAYLDQICEEKKYCSSVQHLAAYLLDIFMDNHRVLQGHLEMALVVCIILAVKLDEHDKMPPKYTDFMDYLPRKYKIAEFFQVEIAILTFFEWNIMFPTVPQFTEYYLLFALLPNDLLSGKPIAHYKKTDVFVKKYVEYFLDVIVQEHEYLQFYPSLVAAACILSIRRCMTITPVWPETLQNVTLYNISQIYDCSILLLEALDEDMVKQQKETPKKASMKTSKRKLSCSESSVTKIVKK